MTAWRVAKTAWKDFRDDDAFLLAAALAYYSALSIGPLMVLGLRFAAVVGHEAEDAMVSQVQFLLGPQASGVLQEIVETARHAVPSSSWGALVGAATLVLSASALFVHLQAAMNRIWDVRQDASSGFAQLVLKRVLSLGMLGAAGFLLAVSLAVSAGIGYAAGRVVPGSSTWWHVINFVLSVGVFTVVFAAMYRYLPDVRIRWRDVWLGATVTAVLFAVGKLGIGVYLGNSSAADAYGAAGSLLVLLIWVWFSALLFFAGAEWTQAWAHAHGRGFVLAEHAKRA